MTENDAKTLRGRFDEDTPLVHHAWALNGRSKRGPGVGTASSMTILRRHPP